MTWLWEWLVVLGLLLALPFMAVFIAGWVTGERVSKWLKVEKRKQRRNIEAVD
jgi:protein-S-isoprenylcysteine O-methyltransferase Ste14